MTESETSRVGKVSVVCRGKWLRVQIECRKVLSNDGSKLFAMLRLCDESGASGFCSHFYRQYPIQHLRTCRVT